MNFKTVLTLDKHANRFYNHIEKMCNKGSKKQNNYN